MITGLKIAIVSWWNFYQEVWQELSDSPYNAKDMKPWFLAFFISLILEQIQIEDQGEFFLELQRKLPGQVNYSTA